MSLPSPPGQVMSSVRRPKFAAAANLSHPMSREPTDEGERGLGDVAPAVVDGQGVSSAGYLGELGHAGVVLLTLVFGVADGAGNGVVVLAGNDQQRSPVRVLHI